MILNQTEQDINAEIQIKVDPRKESVVADNLQHYLQEVKVYFTE